VVGESPVAVEVDLSDPELQAAITIAPVTPFPRSARNARRFTLTMCTSWAARYVMVASIERCRLVGW
jgi:hypothetical protein